MTFGKFILGKGVDNIFRQRKNAQGVGDILAAFANFLTNLMMFEIEFFHQAVEGAGTINRTQVLALNILDDGEFELHEVGLLTSADKYRHLLETG
ncbi:MAG: hypothetical protein A2829_01420 [Candidatus Zambryskibacteria bacterium RIFCSPHIGHO2_01_FULL_43_60]|nr:MAG: hypothetical protein A2829_01420 [Candidatus Zambryskibacteria bacterium RIFCSPHIGHO2_01_FULL_43_60]